MILAEISDEEDTRVRITGHAEKEICAAVSGLFYALLGYVKEAGCVLKKCAVAEGDAELIFRCECKEALKMFEIGLCDIEKAYEKSLSVVKSK